MKNSHILLVLLSLSPAVSALSQQYGWSDISGNLPAYPFDTTIINNGEDTIIAHISDICFINDNEGWISTWHPYSTDSAAILHTTNGGASWEVQMIFRPCSVIHMIDQNTGWAGSDQGLIFKTTDGGNNWTIHGVTGGNITDMSFVPGTDTGYLCTFGATFMHQLTPGGVNPLNLLSPSWWNSVSAPSNELIWICRSSSGVVTYDADGVTDQPTTSANYSSIFFTRNDLGWACGHEGVKGRNEGVLTGCVGKNIAWVHLQYTEGPMNDIFALDYDYVWSVGSDGRIYYSENASQFDRDSLSGDWWSDVVFTSQDHPRPALDLFKVHFTSLHNGFASGRDNTLLKYTQVTGVEEIPAVEYSVYPNPTRGKFQITNSKNQINSKFQNPNNKVEIVDIYGNILEKCKTKNEKRKIELDISHLPAGIYFVRISLENEMIVKKIIKL